MDPTTVFCPNLACPARGQTGQGNIGIHSQKEKRFLCTACRKTFTTTRVRLFCNDTVDPGFLFLY
jgi:transposase-like protein